jgi:heme/copper-type cytochrome/quinol oxidase subunit 3
MQAQSVNTRRLANRRTGAVKAALLLVLGAETIFFSTLIVSYLVMRGEQAARPFPIQGLGDLLLPSLNTLVLLVSALLAGLAERAIRGGRRDALQSGLRWALGLGLLFVAGQVIEFTRSGMHPADAAFGGIYFALVSFHALHVLAGVFVLLLNLIRASLGDFSPRRYMAVQMGSWFWYYVTGVWLVLFTVLYLV